MPTIVKCLLNHHFEYNVMFWHCDVMNITRDNARTCTNYGRGGGVTPKSFTRLRPEIQPLTLLYTLLYTLFFVYLFHIPS